MKRSEITPEYLRQRLSYDPEIGSLTWLHSGTAKWNSRHGGKPAFTYVCPNGYFKGSIYGHPFSAHRVAWAIHHGSWPDGLIDHINGIRTDNRLRNLRVVDSVGNCRNLAMRCDNKSGATGVTVCKGRWRAFITIDGRHIALGHYDTKAEALAVRLKAQQEAGFSERHGTPLFIEGAAA